jgi:hypothetical protein
LGRFLGIVWLAPGPRGRWFKSSSLDSIPSVASAVTEILFVDISSIFADVQPLGFIGADLAFVAAR